MKRKMNLKLDFHGVIEWGSETYPKSVSMHRYQECTHGLGRVWGVEGGCRLTLSTMSHSESKRIP